MNKKVLLVIMLMVLAMVVGGSPDHSKSPPVRATGIHG